jgi:hypothetical protein
MRAASFKSLYQKRPAEDTRRALGCVSGRSRYSTKTCRYRSPMGIPIRTLLKHPTSRFLPCFPSSYRFIAGIISALVLTSSSLGSRLDRTPNRWTFGGGVASTRSECVGAESTMMIRHSHPMHTRREGRHPLCACRAGRQRQSSHATPASAVENKGISARHVVCAFWRRSEHLQNGPSQPLNYLSDRF